MSNEYDYLREDDNYPTRLLRMHAIEARIYFAVIVLCLVWLKACSATATEPDTNAAPGRAIKEARSTENLPLVDCGEPACIVTPGVPAGVVTYTATEEGPVLSSPEFLAAEVSIAIEAAADCVAKDALDEAIREVEELVEIATYIHRVNPKVDARAVAEAISSAARKHEIDPWLFVCVARYESTFRMNARGAAGERGLLQVHKVHRPRMRRLGLDFDSEADRLEFACRLYRERGLRPWTVRNKAMREYRRIKGGK